MIWCRMGSTKAAVLPVPVCAEPMRSPPLRITGMACSWIGVGVVKPQASTACKRRSSRFRFSNDIIRVLTLMARPFLGAHHRRALNQCMHDEESLSGMS